MHIVLITIFTTLLYAASCTAQEKAKATTGKEEVFFDGLGRLTATELLPMFRTQRMLEASSHDRTGDNDDGFAGTYSTIRIEGKGEHVFFEDAGHACVYRIRSSSFTSPRRTGREEDEGYNNKQEY